MAPAVSKTLGEGNTNAQNVKGNADILLPCICLAERHNFSLNTSIVLIKIYYDRIIIKTK